MSVNFGPDDMRHDQHPHSQAAGLAASDLCERLPGSDERRADQSRSAGPLAAGICSLSRAEHLRADPQAIPGFRICDECDGNPAAYLEEFETVCGCNGEGVRPDPDFIDGEGDGSDPHAEFSTMPRLGGRGRGQL